MDSTSSGIPPLTTSHRDQGFNTRQPEHEVVPPARSRSPTLLVSVSCGSVYEPLLRDSADVVAVDSVPVAAVHSTAQNLHLDILSRIFLEWYYLELRASTLGYNTVPFSASQVCRSWREAAHATHRLWTRPDFDTLQLRHPYAWLEYHACFARYSGTFSLTVSITTTVTSVPQRDLVWTHFCSIFLARVTIIELIIDVPENRTNILHTLSAHQLTTLRVTSRGHSVGAEFGCLWSAPMLRHLALERAEVGFEPRSFATSQILERITTLEMTEDRCSVSGLRATWSRYPALVELSVNVEDLIDSNLEPFVWRELEVLRFSVHRVYRAHAIPDRITLLNLQLLEIQDTNEDLWPFWRAFVEVACPRLTHLCIVRNRSDPAYVRPFFVSMWFLSQIRTLVFRNGSLNRDALWYLGITRENYKEAMFPGLREVRFENAVPAPGVQFDAVQSVLNNRLSFLRTNHLVGRFTFVCSFDHSGCSDAEDRVLVEAEQEICRWNDEAWDMH